MADHSMNHIENQRMDEYETRSETVSPLAVVCCFLFLILILLGIALVAAGGVVYQQNDNYMEVRTKALAQMVDRWENECEPRMKALSSKKYEVAVLSKNPLKSFKTAEISTQQSVSSVEENTITVTARQAEIKFPNEKDLHDMTIVAFEKEASDKFVAIAKDVALTKENVEVPAICSCKLVKCQCKAKDMCGKYMEFRGEEKGCTNKKVCGTCAGRGYLRQLCLIGDFCDAASNGSSTDAPGLVGCMYPFGVDNQLYSSKKPSKIKILIFDQNSPFIMQHLIFGGAHIDSHSREQEESQLTGTILFGVGIPIVVLSFLGLVILCACQGWWCFYREDKSQVDVHGVAWDESAIPMYGIDANGKSYVPPQTNSA